MTSQSREPSNRRSPASRLLRWLRQREAVDLAQTPGVKTTEVLMISGPLDDWVVPIVHMPDEPLPDAIPGLVLGVPFPGAYVPMGITDNGKRAYWWDPDE